MGEKLNWPPGYRFKPTDEELICYYLKRRILRQKLYCDIIKDRELYGPNCTPWDLFDVHDNSWIVFKDKPTEKIVYVFTTLSKLRKTDDVRSRENTCKKAGCGTWVGQNKKPIKDGMGNLIGEKRMLVFEITEIGVEFDRSKAGYFKMHEYSLSGVNKGFGSTAGDDFVLCKITFDSAKKLTYKLGLKSDVEICGEGQKKEQIMKNLEHTVCDNLEETGNLPSQSEGSVCGNFEGSECLTSENLVVLDSGISNYDYLLDNCYVAATQECNIAAPEWNELCGDPGFDMDLLIDLLTNDQEEGPKDSNALGKRKFEEEENLSREQSNLSRHCTAAATANVNPQFPEGEIITSTANGTDTRTIIIQHLDLDHLVLWLGLLWVQEGAGMCQLIRHCWKEASKMQNQLQSELLVDTNHKKFGMIGGSRIMLVEVDVSQQGSAASPVSYDSTVSRQTNPKV
ncbi:hypothetical protein POM88_023408 [Heracleum sosnowskyi]|uniref:NAC domain-containing protein n=1 Tax=Heracleum sosnowskyi TaxID=360622 RepID=A0AAD8II83_9APIA|nr:hypothetical protein POM88_023408 [Heracleum sosnowskyi]